MKTYEHYEELRQMRRRTGIFCDRCNKEISDNHCGNVYSFTLEVEKGVSWPEGGTVNIWEVEDLCEACSDELRQLLEEFGATINEREIDF